jgi:hypothetical protein
MERGVCRQVPPQLGFENTVVGWKHNSEPMIDTAHQRSDRSAFLRTAQKPAARPVHHDLSVFGDHFTTQHGQDRPPAEGHSLEGRPLRARADYFGCNTQYCVLIDQDEISIEPHGDAALAVIETERLRRALGQKHRDLSIGDAAGSREIKHSRSQSIEARRAARARPRIRLLFFGNRMWGMV